MKFFKRKTKGDVPQAPTEGSPAPAINESETEAAAQAPAHARDEAATAASEQQAATAAPDPAPEATSPESTGDNGKDKPGFALLARNPGWVPISSHFFPLFNTIGPARLGGQQRLSISCCCTGT